MMLRVGFALPHYDTSIPGERPLRWASLAHWVRTADQLGFESLWVSDHLFTDGAVFGAPRGRVDGLDALPMLGAVARLTRRARLGTLVLCTPLRPPPIVAKATATLDVLSGGRLTVGLGAGWFEPEFEEAGVPFGSPGARLRTLGHAIEELRRVWTGEGAPCRPGPVQQPCPPIWVGGRGDRLLRLVARHADGWNTAWTSTVERYRERSAVIDQSCEQVGRDPAAITRSLGLHTLVGEDHRDLERRFERLQRLSPPGTVRAASLAEWRHGRLVGTVEEVREQLEAWTEAGVDELIVNAGALPFHVVDVDDLAGIAHASSLVASWEASELQN